MKRVRLPQRFHFDAGGCGDGFVQQVNGGHNHERGSLLSL